MVVFLTRVVDFGAAACAPIVEERGAGIPLLQQIELIGKPAANTRLVEQVLPAGTFRRKRQNLQVQPLICFAKNLCGQVERSAGA